MISANSRSASFQVAQGLVAHVDSSPIDHLLEAARCGFRLFELFRLASPDELAHYLDVVVRADVAPRVSWWPEVWIDGEPPYRWQTPLERPPWAGYFGTDPDLQRRWLASGMPARAVAAAEERWPDVEAVRAQLRASQDPLVRFELDALEAGQHENDLALLEPHAWPELQRHFRYWPRRHWQDAEYTLIASLLAHADIQALTHRGRGDWFVIQQACAEQQRRCRGVPTRQDNAFPVRALTPYSGRELFDCDDDRRVSLNPNPAWTRAVRFQSEGIQLEGLCLDEGGFGATPLALRETGSVNPDVRVLLTPRNCRAASSPRHWFQREALFDVGVAPDWVAAFAQLLEAHGWQHE